MLQPPTMFEVRKQHTFGFSINRHGDLAPCPFDLEPVGWATFLPILVFLGPFVIDLWANNCQTDHVTLSDGPRDLATLTFALGGRGACR